MSMHQTPPSPIAVTLARGGTSKGVFVELDGVPCSEDKRRDWCLQLMGTPDPMQLDGLGGTYSSTSKIMAVAPTKRLSEIPWAKAQATAAQGAFELPVDAVPRVADSKAESGTGKNVSTKGKHSPAPSVDVADCDLVSWFAQVGIDRPTVDWRGNCGNLTSAVVPFALHRGMLTRGEGRQTVRLFNINTATKIDVTLPVDAGRLDPAGDFAIAGVPGTAARIDTKYLSPAGSVTGSALPTGAPLDQLHVTDPRTGQAFEVNASIVDVSTPIVIVDPTGLGLPSMATPTEMNENLLALRLLENIRTAAAERIGLLDESRAPLPAIPRVVLVSAAAPETTAHRGQYERRLPGIRAYATSMSRIHHSLPGTVMLALAGAARLRGTLVHTALAGKAAAGFAAGPPEVFDGVAGLATASPDISVTHPKGTAVVSAPHDEKLPWVSLPRTARILLDGTYYLP